MTTKTQAPSYQTFLNALGDLQESWSLHFAPHIGLNSEEDGYFAPVVGQDPVEQIAVAADLGFKAIEDNFMRYRPKADQARIAAALERRDMRLATFVATFLTTGPSGSVLAADSLTLAARDEDTRTSLRQEITEAAELCKRFGGGYATLLSGRTDPRLPRDYQTANVISNLRDLADIAEKAGLTLGLEPINARQWTGTFVTTVPHGNLIVQAVDHPSVRLIFDAYHVQIETGSILENMALSWPSIGYVQVADAPGRATPGSGEINYNPVFHALVERSFDGYVGLEHAHAKAGIAGVTESLRAIERK
ncbi:MAG: TIM barrel protein [Pseudomonadota bacterium]